MPDTFLSLVLFVVFLAPGLAFFLAREVRSPQRELSAFRETSTVVLMGVVCDGLAILILLIVRLIEPSWAPNISKLLTEPADYLKSAPVFLAWWVIVVVLLACGIGGFLGFVKWWPRIGSIRFESAWYKVFHEFPDDVIYCSCDLDDGSWIGGYLKSSNTDVEETEDRELILSRPRYRGPEAEGVHDLGVTYSVVSARRIVRLDVSYLPPEND